MTLASTETPPVGGRISSPKFRASLDQSENFTGLTADMSGFDALRLVKQVGREGGFTPELIEMLEYYLVRTNEIDWTEGNRPICYQAVTTTALDLGISERQVLKRERALHDLGALTWNDSGNHKRYGMRDRDTGVILYAFGADLSPLAVLVPALTKKIAEKKAQKELWNHHKRQISGLRARIRALIAEASLFDELADILITMQNEYERISYSIRTYHTHDRLMTLLEEHKLVYRGLTEALEACSKPEDNNQNSCDDTSADAIEFRHIHNTNIPESDKSDYSRAQPNVFKEDVAHSPRVSGQSKEAEGSATAQTATDDQNWANITTKQMLNACSERFKSRIPMHSRAMTWDDLVEAAYAVLPLLGIHKSAWNDACAELGSYRAAICIMIIDQKAQDPENPVRSPGGYLRRMTARARTGELNLLGSVFGLLKREEGRHDA